ncbi:arylamine N-acetyltransferase [Evansella sp. AB-rgal1]|uniref:arylamine N-acetyltransferase n=1 Tax=Evansella sp. AB-rgal1 TaxID=3242696 RepID=UPI00359CF1B8
MTYRTDSVLSYLNILHLQPEKPSLQFLQKICHAHLNTFPFENISKLLFFRDCTDNLRMPSFKLFTENYSKYHFGGTCYVINSNLMILLKELGFDCYHVMLGNQHMGIIVKLDKERYYVDCGATAPFFEPVSFENDSGNVSQFGKDEVYLLPINQKRKRYKYVRYINGKQNGQPWHFYSRKEAKVADFREVIEKTNIPNAPFMSILRCHLYQTSKQRSLSLVNNKFSIRYSSGETNVITLSSIEEMRDVLSEEYKFPKLPIKEAMEVLKILDVDIFQ